VVEAFHRGMRSWFDGRCHPQLHKMLFWMYNTDANSYATLLARRQPKAKIPKRNWKVLKREIELKKRMDVLRVQLSDKPEFTGDADWLAKFNVWTTNYPGSTDQLKKDLTKFLRCVTFTLPFEFIPQKYTAKTKKSKSKKKNKK
jgi:hypothetical protein